MSCARDNHFDGRAAKTSRSLKDAFYVNYKTSSSLKDLVTLDNTIGIGVLLPLLKKLSKFSKNDVVFYDPFEPMCFLERNQLSVLATCFAFYLEICNFATLMKYIFDYKIANIDIYLFTFS